MARRWIRLAVGLAVLVAVFLALRGALGLELGPASIGATVERLGPFAPLAFVGLVVFRVPLGLPSQLVLIGGGAVFGTLEGTLYGAVGLLLSALVYFLAARWAGREAVEARLPERLRGLLDVAGSRAGALFMSVGTAYPFGPITGYHLLAGVTAMSLLVFALAVGAGALVRAALYTAFGSALVEGDGRALLVAGAAALAALLLPLAFAAPRGWLLQALGRRRTA